MNLSRQFIMTNFSAGEIQIFEIYRLSQIDIQMTIKKSQVIKPEIFC